MSDSEKIIICDNCSNEVKDSDDYCQDCGILFVDEIKCLKHTEKDAEGICVICSEPFCTECILNVNGVFLCNNHSEFEFHDGMARVYGSGDAIRLEYVKSCLSEAGLHPGIYSRQNAHRHEGAVDQFLSQGDFNGHLVYENKLMVPFREVLKALEILRELELDKAFSVH